MRRRLLAAGVGVLFALLVTEIAFRVLGLGGPAGAKCLLLFPGPSEYHCYPTNPSGEFRPVPPVVPGCRLYKLHSPFFEVPLDTLSETPWCVEYRRETPGIRGPAVSPAPAPGVMRIAGIGDSFALGEGVPYEKTLFVHLARLLGPTSEILNFGRSGDDTDNALATLGTAAPRWRCSRALVIFNLNDVALSPEIQGRMGEIYDLVHLRAGQMQSDSRGGLHDISRIAAFITSAAEVRRITRDTVASYVDAYDPARNGANLAQLDAQLRRMAHAPGCSVGLVVYPMMYGLDGAYPLQACHDRVVQMAKDAGLPVLDLAPAFAGQDAESLHVHPIDHHPNGRAHEIAARAIAEWIAKQPSLRW